jgi:hypothetical protein
MSNGHGGGVYIINNSTDKILTEKINNVNFENNEIADILNDAFKKVGIS